MRIAKSIPAVLSVVAMAFLFIAIVTSSSQGQGWQPPGWTNPNTNPGPPMPKPERERTTPGDDPKINPTHDPDVRKGANDYCATHSGGVCGSK
jgi:hypothetical protein